MKRIALISIILLLSCNKLSAIANNSQHELQEIHPDLNTGFKEYKIKQPQDNNDHKEIKDQNDDDMPFEIMSSPLKLLKQYQEGNY